MEPLIPAPAEDTPCRGRLTARRQVFARYRSHFSDLKAFNQLSQGACQSCQTTNSLHERHSREGQREVVAPKKPLRKKKERQRTPENVFLLHIVTSDLNFGGLPRVEAFVSASRGRGVRAKTSLCQQTSNGVNVRAQSTHVSHFIGGAKVLFVRWESLKLTPGASAALEEMLLSYETA